MGFNVEIIENEMIWPLSMLLKMLFKGKINSYYTIPKIYGNINVIIFIVIFLVYHL